MCTPPTPTDISWLLEEKRLIVKFLHCDKLQATARTAVLQYSRSEIRRELLLYFQSIIFTFTYLYVSCGLQLSFL